MSLGQIKKICLKLKFLLDFLFKIHYNNKHKEIDKKQGEKI